MSAILSPREIRRRPFAVLLTALLIATCFTGAVRGEEKADSCKACHSALPDRLGAPVDGMKEDVHAEVGLSCADCHGGDPTRMDLSSMERERGFRGVPARAEVPDFCGRCHSDAELMRRYNPGLPTNQRERYRTSVHGKRLAEGDTKVATCTSCHGVHGIRSGKRADSPVYPANIPTTCGHCHSNAETMAGYGIRTDQAELYRRSVHGELLLQRRDLSAPSCATCHDNHGASPPGLTSIAEVCGQCHVHNARFFVASPHKPAFDRLGFPECVTCHGNHEIHRTSDTMLGVDADAPCARCHGVNSAGYVAAKSMRDAIDGLRAAIDSADRELRRAEGLGMEVSDVRYEFRETGAILIKARTAVHRFSPQAVDEAVKSGLDLAMKTQHAADAALDEAWARRRNLLLPLAIIGILMVLLALRLRRLEKTGSSGPG